MSEMNLQEIIEARLTEDAFDLPVIDHTALKLQEIMASSKCDLATLAQIIQSDQSLAIKVLNLANSPFFSGLRRISSVEEAIIRVGMKEIFVLVVTLAQRNLYRTKDKEYASFMKMLWEHALGTATASRWLSKRMNRKDEEETLFIGGLLHDIGKLVLFKIVQDIQKEEHEPKVEFSKSLIEEMFDSLHPAVGATLLEKQRLPEFYCQVARNHHQEDNETEEAIDIIKTANLICRKLGIGLKHDPELILTASITAERLGLTDIDFAELEVTMGEMLNDFNQRIG